MKNKTLSFLLAMLMSMVASVAHAYTIYFSVISEEEKTAKISYRGSSWDEYSNEYTGSITIPKTVTSSSTGNTYTITAIDDNTFRGCSGLTSVKIPNSVTSIGNYAFRDCSGLTSVIIGNSVTSIGYSPFYGTKEFRKTIWLTNTPPSGYANAYGGVNYVANDQYPELSNTKVYPYLSSLFEVDGIKYVPVSPSERTCDAIDCCYNSSAEHINIGKTVSYRGVSMTVKNVQPCVCYGNEYIKDAAIDYGGDIPAYAFYGCSGLTSVEIPNSVTSIGNYAFYECSGLTSIEIPNSVTSIGGWTFAGCTALTSVNIPESVTSMYGGFSGCTSLSTITIPEGMTSIGGFMFRGCTNLASVIISNSVTFIGWSAFEGCKGLNSITIPSSVTEIERNAFRYCNGLKELILQDGTADLKFWWNYYDYGDDKGLFYDCPLKYLYLGRNIFGSPFSGNKALTSATIGESVTSIGGSAFSGCSGLTSIEIPNSVTSIGGSAFSGCSGLTSIEIPNSVTSIGGSTFSGCSGLTSIEIPNSVTSIGDEAFRGCTGLTSVEIPESVTSIGSSAFSGCTGLTSIVIPNSVTSIGNSAFYNCSGLTSVTINSNAIASKTYSSSSTLASIFGSQVKNYVFGNEVKGIGDYACYKSTSLTSVTVGNSVTSIGDWAFSGCTGLTTFSFGPSIKSIGKEAFSDCTAMTKLYGLAPIPPVCGDQALDDINKWKCTLIVPEGYTSAYQAAPQWKEFFFTEGTEVEKYTISIVVNGKVYETESIAGLPLNIEDIVTETPVKEGYTFVGWEGLPETVPAHDVEITAIFEVNSYTVTFMYGNEVLSTASVEYGAEIPLPESLGSDRYTLVAWKDVPETMPARDITIYADYTDGIEDVNDNVNADKQGVYDLSGRKMNVNVNVNDNVNNSKFEIQNSKLRKGIYIVNGKKTVVR